jgi:hypothetical protein
VGGPFLDIVVSTDRWCSHNVSQYGVTKAFFEELNAFWASKHVFCLLRQFFELGYIGIYVVVFELEFGNLRSGSVLSGCVEVLDLKFLKEEVP